MRGKEISWLSSFLAMWRASKSQQQQTRKSKLAVSAKMKRVRIKGATDICSRL